MSLPTTEQILNYLLRRFQIDLNNFIKSSLTKNTSFYIAGGAVANSILSLVDGVDYGIGDIDLFTSDTSFMFGQRRTMPRVSEETSHLQVLQAYELNIGHDKTCITFNKPEDIETLPEFPPSAGMHVINNHLFFSSEAVSEFSEELKERLLSAALWAKNLSSRNLKPFEILYVFNSSLFPKLNVILSSRINHASELLNTFDLNCTKAAINLRTNQLVVSESFLSFLKKRRIKIDRITSSSEIINRTLKKSFQLNLDPRYQLEGIAPVLNSPLTNPLEYMQELEFKNLKLWELYSPTYFLNYFESPLALSYKHKSQDLERIKTAKESLKLPLIVLDSGFIKISGSFSLLTPLEYAEHMEKLLLHQPRIYHEYPEISSAPESCTENQVPNHLRMPGMQRTELENIPF